MADRGGYLPPVYMGVDLARGNDIGTRTYVTKQDGEWRVVSFSEEQYMGDPTYSRQEIDAKPEWKIAFILSEIWNDNAPIGWAKFIPAAAKAIADAREVRRG